MIEDNKRGGVEIIPKDTYPLPVTSLDNRSKILSAQNIEDKNILLKEQLGNHSPCGKKSNISNIVSLLRASQKGENHTVSKTTRVNEDLNDCLRSTTVIHCKTDKKSVNNVLLSEEMINNTGRAIKAYMVVSKTAKYSSDKDKEIEGKKSEENDEMKRDTETRLSQDTKRAPIKHTSFENSKGKTVEHNRDSQQPQSKLLNSDSNQDKKRAAHEAKHAQIWDIMRIQ